MRQRECGTGQDALYARPAWVSRKIFLSPPPRYLNVVAGAMESERGAGGGVGAIAAEAAHAVVGVRAVRATVVRSVRRCRRRVAGKIPDDKWT